MSTNAQIRASKKYNDTHTVPVYVRLNRVTDKDILDRLSAVENKQGYIKRLIREDIERGK